MKILVGGKMFMCCRFRKAFITDELTITWNPNGGTSFTVVLGTDTVSNIMDSSYTFTGLTPNTQYNYAVATECPTAISTFVFGSVRTLCLAMDSLPYVQTFESESTGSSSTGSVFVNCWQRLNNGTSSGGYPYVSSSSSYNHTPGGSKGLYWYNTTTTGTYGDYQCVVLPSVDTDLYPINTLQLRFWAKSSSTSYYPLFYVGVMSNPADINSFQPVDTINVGNNTTWTEYTTIFSHFVGHGQAVAVKAVRPSSSWYAYVDDIVLEPIPSCPPPQGLTLLNGTDPDSITFSWTEMGEASEWMIVAVPQGGNPDTCTTGSVVSDENALLQLLGGMAYDVYVRSICGGTDSSSWTGPVTVIPGMYLMGTSGSDTLRTCRGVICDSGGPNGSYGMSEDFTLYILPGSTDSILSISGTSYTESSYDYIRIYDGLGTGGTQVWNDYGTTANQTFGPFVSLTGAFTITWHSDGSVVYDGFQINVRCLAQPNCPAPSDFNLTYSSVDTVSVAWSDTSSTGTYDLCFGPQGMDPDTVVYNILTVVDTVYDFTNLMAGQTYDLYVRANCGSDQSWWVGPITVNPGSYNMPASGTDTIRACSITIYDDGGPLGQYSNNGNSTLVLRAPHPDSLFVFTGEAYTESTLDQLTIYDGEGTSGTVLWQTSSSTVRESIPMTRSNSSVVTLRWHTDGSVVYDGFEVNFTCQTAPNCNSISELVVSHVAGTSALLEWDVSSGNTGGDPAYYNVTVNGVTDTTSQSPYWLTGLTPGTHYYVTVQGVCATTGTSFYVTDDFVTTCLAGGDLEISGGTGSNLYYPLNAGVNYSYTQEIYAASQLGGPMTITGVAYHLQSNGCSTRNISLYLGEVTRSSLTTDTSYIPLSQLHLVYTGTFSGAANTWSNIYFDSTFNYTGMGNLVVALDDNTGYTGSANFYTSSGTDRAIHFHNSTDINPASPSGTTQHNTGIQNDIRFLAPCDTTATCVSPNVAVFYTTTTEAYVSWAPGLNETSWNVAHRIEGSSTWIVDTTAYSGTTFLVTGLLPNTQYTFRVTGICTDTLLDGFESARTQCGAVTALPISEDFESASTGSSTTGSPFVQCWHRLNNGTSYGGYPYVSSSTTYNHTTGGTKGLYWYNTTTTGTYGDYQCVVLPEVDSSISIDSLQVSFWAKASSASYIPVFQIGVMTDPDDVTTFEGVDTVIINGTNWQQVEVPLAAYTGNGHYVAVKADRPSSSWYAYVDDFILEYTPTCVPPRNVFASDASTTTITLDWVDITPAMEWQIEYGPQGYTRGSTAGIPLTVTSHPVYIVGLDTLTNYDFYIRPICTVGDTARWSYANTLSTAMCDNSNAFSVGSASSSGSTYYAPVNNYYRYTLSEVILDSAEIDGPMDVQYIGYYYDYSSPSTDKTNCTIYFQPTTLSTFASSSDVVTLDSTAVKVYTGHLNCSQGWNYFALDTVYHYDGLTNLMVIVDDNSDDYNGIDYVFKSEPCTGNKTLYYYSDTYDPDVTSVTSSYSGSKAVASWRPVMQLVSCMGGSCRQPIVTGITHTYENATITWSGEGTAYEVNIKESTATDWPATDIAVTGNTYTFTALQPATSYTFRVRQDCNADSLGYSEWTIDGFVTDSLPCLVPDSLHVTAVTNATATLDWNPRGYETVWEIHVWTSGGLDSVYAATSHPATVVGFTANTAYNASVRPLCGTLGNIIGDWGDTITFTTAVCPDVTGLGTRGVTANSVEVYWDPDPMAQTWIIEYGFHGFDLGTGTQVTTSLTTYTINGLMDDMEYDFRVRAVCGDNWQSEGWATTSATTLVGGVPCDPPTAVSAVVAGNAATVSWTANTGNISFVLEYGTRGFALGSGTTVNATASPVTISNLDYETAYDVYVKANCADNTSSAWSTVASFTTEAQGSEDCDPVTDLAATNVTESAALLTWTPGNSGDEWEVVLTTAAGATVSENSTTERQFQLTGLTPGTAYVAKVRTVCGDGQYSTFASVSFTTNSVGIADVTAPACTIYPNPTSGATTVSVSGISGKVRIAIVDMNGREVTSETLDCSGDCAKTMSVDNLAQGAYFVRITGENANMVRKLIVR